MAKEQTQQAKDLDFLDYLRQSGIDPDTLSGNLQAPQAVTQPSPDDQAAAMNAIQPGSNPAPQQPSEGKGLDIKNLLSHALSQVGGKGMDDDVAATVAKGDGSTEPASLSAGEWIIPADVVSLLGDGNTEAGSKVLEQLINNIRKAKTGKTSQPDPLTELLGQ